MKKIIEKLKACKGYVSLSNEECDKIVPILESSELLQETLQEVQVTLGKLQEKANDGANGIIIEGVKYTLVRDKDMSSIDTSLKCPPKHPAPAYATDGRTCSTCANSYDWHHPALDGPMTLGRCPYYTNGKFCVIASERACEHYKPKQ